MVHRLIRFAIIGALIVGFGSGARSNTLPPPPAVDEVRAAGTTANVAFAITVPSKSQTAENEPLARIAAATRSATLTVFAKNGTSTATTVACAAACAGSVSLPLGSPKFVAKLFSAEGGTGRLLATGTTRQAITTQTSNLRFTFNPMVGSVRLGLKNSVISGSTPGATTLLLITALDPTGAVIIGPFPYVDRNGKPISIAIANSSPSNTTIAPTAFARPLPGYGVSNVSTITFKGRAHFHYPTFTVANAGLPSLPSGGVTLTYAPGSGADFEATSSCIGSSASNASFSSVGGLFYGSGPYVALAEVPGTGNCSGTPPIADIWHLGNFVNGPHYSITQYSVNPLHDSTASLGFGSDKQIYFAYTPSAANSPTQFGYLRDLTMRTSANVSAVSQLTLGNDGSLWFSGVWNGQATIGKLPPASGCCWSPRLFSVPNADAVISMEPGIGNTEALLYHASGGVYLGTIRTDLSGFKSVVVLPGSTDPGFGDLLAGPGGTFYASVGSSDTGTVYQISSTGGLSTFCQNVQKVYRLSDGTGVGLHKIPPNSYHAFVHVVPGQGCTTVLVYPLENEADWIDLLGIDSTTDDWIFYANPSGHRVGLF